MRALRTFLLSAASGVALLANVNASADTPVAITYVPNSLAEASIANGPWTLHQKVGRNAHDASGVVPTIPTPYNPPTSNFGTPYKNYCVDGRVQTARGINPMQPYYFPFVRKNDGHLKGFFDDGAGNEREETRSLRNNGGYLEGFFDYRPRNEQEATVAAVSLDWGKSWIFTGEALGLNPYCPADPTDPDNNNVIVGGLPVGYTATGDNGLGHAFVMNIGGNQLIYHLDRANGIIDSAQLVVHKLEPEGTNPLAGLPDLGFVSPLTSRGYPTLEASAGATKDLITPDAFLGAVPMGGGTTAVVYVSKQLNASTTNNCQKAPTWSLTFIDTGKQRAANTDVVTIRVATTTDGITFKDVGIATGLLDATTVANNGTRWVGSGSIIALSNGHYALFFGGGNCLDNDSDAFHYLGYAETTNPVNSPSDLQSWTVIYGFDNPILSTDTVTDPMGNKYPANPPLVNVTNADVLTAAQVSPWVPPTGHNTNFFSGRVYDPQAIYTDSTTETIVFAGYNTPQPSSNLGDYRTIGRFQLRFPAGYLAPPRRNRNNED